MHDHSEHAAIPSKPCGVGRRSFLAGGALLLAAGNRAAAQAPAVWPTRPVRVVVPYPPGGTADLVARILFEPVSRRLGQPFVIENRSGATGTIGAGAVP